MCIMYIHYNAVNVPFEMIYVGHISGPWKEMYTPTISQQRKEVRWQKIFVHIEYILGHVSEHTFGYTEIN